MGAVDFLKSVWKWLDKVWGSVFGGFEEARDLGDLKTTLNLKWIKDALMQNNSHKEKLFPDWFEKLDIAHNLIIENIKLFNDPKSQTLAGFLIAVLKVKWLKEVLVQINDNIDFDALNESQKWMAYILLAYANIVEECNPSSVTDLSNVNDAYFSAKASWEETIMVKNNEWKYVPYEEIDQDMSSNKSYGSLANWLLYYSKDVYDFAPNAESVADSSPATWASIDPVVAAQQAIINPAWVTQTELKTA